jgi:hypothetical protein
MHIRRISTGKMAVAFCCQEKRFGLKNKMHKTADGKGQKPEGCLDREDYWKKVPPTLHAVLAEQVTRMAVLVMLVNGL